MNSNDDELPAGLPELHLLLRPVSPEAWGRIVRRTRRRRNTLVASAAAATAVVVAVPAVALSVHQKSAAVPAHQPGSSFDGICDTAFDKPAPAGDRLGKPFRVANMVMSPPGPNQPAVAGEEIRRRAVARGTKFSPGTQLRYGLVRHLSGGKVSKTELRWILTACGQPRQRFAPTTRPGKQVTDGTVLMNDVQLLTDSGALTTGGGGASFAGVCDTRLDRTAPPEARLKGFFYIGESSVAPPLAGEELAGRDRVIRALRDQHLDQFPGTQIRLGRVTPLHTPGPSPLRWLVTTCGLDGGSVRPQLPGVVNELLIFDNHGSLLQRQRSGPQSEAERYIATFPPVPNPAPTYQAAGPNICGPWSHAYPDFRTRALQDGYIDMQGCYLQSNAVVIFVSSPGGRAAAAVDKPGTPKAYQDHYDKRFPYSRFRFIPAPTGDTIRLVRLLNPHVAEVELSSGGQSTSRWKFDATTTRFLPCADVSATAAPCGG